MPRSSRSSLDLSGKETWFWLLISWTFSFGQCLLIKTIGQGREVLYLKGISVLYAPVRIKDQGLVRPIEPHSEIVKRSFMLPSKWTPLRSLLHLLILSTEPCKLQLSPEISPTAGPMTLQQGVGYPVLPQYTVEQLQSESTNGDLLVSSGVFRCKFVSYSAPERSTGRVVTWKYRRDLSSA